MPIKFCMLNICVFLGTMGNIMVPKNNCTEKYDIQAFQRRDDNPHRFNGSKLINLGTLMILINVKGYAKYEFFDENYSRNSNSKHLKNVSGMALESLYFPGRILLSTILVPENNIHSIKEDSQVFVF